MRAAAPAPLGAPVLPRALLLLLLLAGTINCCLQSPAANAQTLPLEEVEALKQIASKLKIPATLWNFDVNPCTEWIKEDRDPYAHNVTCQEFSTITTNATTNKITNTTAWHVVSIFLESNMMQGPLPRSLGKLTNLKRLAVYHLKRMSLLHGILMGTFMEGPFPPEFSLLLSLTQLRVSDLKNVGGSFPPLENLLGLKDLDLSFNNLTGEIPENFMNLRRLTTMDISYNTFTDLSSAPANCEQESRIASCLRKDLPCDGMAKSERVVVDGNEYEPDPSLEGTSKYYLSRSGKWALSSTGNFIGGSRAPFVAENTSTLTMPNAELYTSARLNPLSLKYYGLCLQPGNYTVKLHFAEIVFTSGPTFGNLGRRVFDVSIQGKKVLRNFNIVDAANGTGKEVIRNFTALVEGGTLEIHFVWSGKGTNSIPYRSVYGPLISAIAVTPSVLHTAYFRGQYCWPF
ncbi:unnamed protein product [Spirodela intermedia]|uniref:Malectin domain-containing protein n=1 Tax=Spirodela intermedia TaxID=51605 RepID=A0A7I8KZA5_SPIIN|nr:unnamed protein product [Spirodela intermedia]